jgi:hypothetical protein
MDFFGELEQVSNSINKVSKSDEIKPKKKGSTVSLDRNSNSHMSIERKKAIKKRPKTQTVTFETSENDKTKKPSKSKKEPTRSVSVVSLPALNMGLYYAAGMPPSPTPDIIVSKYKCAEATVTEVDGPLKDSKEKLPIPPVSPFSPKSSLTPISKKKNRSTSSEDVINFST